MGKVEVRPSTIADLEEYTGRLPSFRVRAETARMDGEIIGIGGIASLPNGSAIAFLDLKDAMRTKAPVSLMRACKRGIREAVARGAITISAMASPDIPGARAFLERVGFRCIDAGAGVYLYEARQ